jgi:hypothetical protein
MKKIISVTLVVLIFFSFGIPTIAKANGDTERALWISTGLGVLNFLNNVGNSKKIKRAYEKQAEYYQAATEKIKGEGRQKTAQIKVEQNEIEIKQEKQVALEIYKVVPEGNGFSATPVVDKIKEQGKYMFVVVGDNQVTVGIEVIETEGAGKKYILSLNRSCKVEGKDAFYGIVNISKTGSYNCRIQHQDKIIKIIEVNIPATQ